MTVITLVTLHPPPSEDEGLESEDEIQPYEGELLLVRRLLRN